METLAKIFNHLARDLFFYVLPGSLILINATYLDYVFFEGHSYHHFIKISYSYALIIFLAYIMGQIIFASMYLIIELSGFESFIKKKFFPIDGESWDIDFKKEIVVFKKSHEMHEQFIERHTQLYLQRWNLSGAFVFCCIMNLVFCFMFSSFKYPFLFSIGYFISGVLLYILSLKTEKDCYERIQYIE